MWGNMLFDCSRMRAHQMIIYTPNLIKKFNIVNATLAGAFLWPLLSTIISRPAVYFNYITITFLLITSFLAVLTTLHPVSSLLERSRISNAQKCLYILITGVVGGASIPAVVATLMAGFNLMIFTDPIVSTIVLFGAMCGASASLGWILSHFLITKHVIALGLK